MFCLKHITDEELRRYYYLEGHISGNVKNVNILNGIQQDYVGSKINDFITWSDDFGKHKFELYVKENIPKMELEYEKIVKEKQMREKERDEIELKKKQMIWKLVSSSSWGNTTPLEQIHILNKFNISEVEYETERKKYLADKVNKRRNEESKSRANKFYNDLQADLKAYL